jgi:L,D-transpeptidase catalytic domain
MELRVRNRAPAEWHAYFQCVGQRISEVMYIPVKPCQFLLLGLLPLLMGSCASRSKPQPLRAQKILHSWHDDGGSGEVNIRISLPDQIAEFERGGRPIGWCYVATGKEGFGTKPGKYRIMEKIEDKYSNRYGWIEDEFGNVVNPDAKAGARVPEGMIYVPAPMPYWMRLTSYGIGMHGGLIPEPGKPASHGCIRLPKQFVPLLYDSVEVGTQVAITNTPSTQGPYFESVPQPQFDGNYRVINSRPVDGPPPGYPGY